MEKRIEELRSRLNKILVKELKTIEEVAKEVGIHRMTMADFLNAKTKQHITILGKIEQYVNMKERQ